jgi:putative ABC transport system ATP-binding protein
MSSSKLIELIGVSKIYQMGEVKVVALDEITLQIEPGEFVAIMGPSGSGKSTLLNILGCLDRPTEGQYLLDGEDVSQLSRKQLAHIRNRKIGFVFQSYNLLAQSNALENVMLPIIYSRNGWRSKSDRLERARAVLATVGLAEREKHKPLEMSGGQQQRVAIGRALINDPPLILADEPTGNLDSHSGQEIMQILDELNAQGRTIVMVTHEAEVAVHAQRTLHVWDGRIEKIHVNGFARDSLAVAAAGGINESL